MSGGLSDIAIALFVAGVISEEQRETLLRIDNGMTETRYGMAFGTLTEPLARQFAAEPRYRSQT